MRELPALGITASNLTTWSAKELRRTDRAGVRVNGVRPGGPAAEAKPPLADDDVIVAIDGQPVPDVEALMALDRAADRAADRRAPSAGPRRW